MDDYDLTITEEGVFERVYRVGEEPVMAPLRPHVVIGFDTGQVDTGEGVTAVIVLMRMADGQEVSVAMDAVTAKALVVALTGNIGRLVTGLM